MTTTQHDELAAVVRELGGRLTSAVADLHGLVINDCLVTETLTLPADGCLTRDWTVPYGSVAVHNAGYDPLTVTNAGAAGSAPTSGPGVVVVGVGVALTANVSGRTLTLYGTPGGRVVLSVFTKPQPPTWAQIGSL